MMHTSISCKNQQDACVELLGKLRSTDQHFDLLESKGSLIFIIPLWIESLKDYKRTQMALKGIRSIINSGTINSENAQYLQALYELSKSFRDNYLNIYNRVSKTRLMSFFFKRITEKSLNDWDELTTDCYVGSDDEFRKLVLQVAENT